MSSATGRTAPEPMRLPRRCSFASRSCHAAMPYSRLAGPTPNGAQPMSVDSKGRERSVERIERFQHGGVRARGHTINGALTGYWEWYRKDGTKLRSGYFEAGAPVDEW